MTIIDARGRSCPEPVLMTRDALASEAREYEVLVDNRTAVENVTRFANRAGYSVELAERESAYCLSLQRR